MKIAAFYRKYYFHGNQKMHIQMSIQLSYDHLNLRDFHSLVHFGFITLKLWVTLIQFLSNATMKTEHHGS